MSDELTRVSYLDPVAAREIAERTRAAGGWIRGSDRHGTFAKVGAMVDGQDSELEICGEALISFLLALKDLLELELRDGRDALRRHGVGREFSLGDGIDLLVGRMRRAR